MMTAEACTRKYLDFISGHVTTPTIAKYWDFVQKNGQWFRGRENSRLRLPFKPKECSCYYNSQLLALLRQMTYFEGWACDGYIPVPFEHAWCAKEGKVFDLTWDLADKKLKRNLAKEVVYFGVEIPAQMIRKHLFKSNVAEPLLTKLIFAEG